jgi:hypothetical protein
MTHARLRAALVALALPVFAGCGGADLAAPATPAKVPSAEEVSTVDGASAAVDHAERAIDELLGPPGASTAVAVQAAESQVHAEKSAAPPPPPPPPPPAAPAAAPPSSAPAARGATAADKDDREARKPPAVAVDACSTACSALASMERATEHLCDLAGAGDARCTTARTRVKNASLRVRAACPICSGP